VISGVSPGDRLVVNPTGDLTEGIKVRTAPSVEGDSARPGGMTTSRRDELGAEGDLGLDANIRRDKHSRPETPTRLNIVGAGTLDALFRLSSFGVPRHLESLQWKYDSLASSPSWPARSLAQRRSPPKRPTPHRGSA
jgi:hypothetical protein